jgi:hypothetical protein
MHKLTTIALLAAATFLQASAPVAAADTMKSTSMTSSSMSSHDNTKMAKCPAKDPAVIMNTTKHTFMLDTKANRDAMKGMMSNDKFICESQAKKMGAKMVSAPSHGMKKM